MLYYILNNWNWKKGDKYQIVRCAFYTQVGEVWHELCAELKEEFRPVASDEEALKVISEISEDTGRMIAALQTEVLESQHHQEIQEEEKTYTKVRQGIFKQGNPM